ncbi:transducin beta-like protein 2 [Paramacrobiotus metropolitanus]|uniref:transducin beta-like protein 2 n=1 Tax=Paramacrobiotus metropolitanus TaxID=2943436 RepID=UPI002445BD2D|nr:transducin beta-like protein 2 [Paramacrobiotus metropolitanus]
MADSQASSLLSWSSITTLSITLLFGGVLIYIFRLIFGKKTDAETASADATVADRGAAEKAKAAKETGKSKSARAVPSKDAAAGKGTAEKYRHPLLVASLKGHSADICDGHFNASGKYLVTSAEDRSLILWTCSDFLTDDPAKEPRSKRVNLELDHASLIRFSPDSKAVIGRMHNADVVRVFKLTKNADGQWSAPQALHDVTNQAAHANGEIRCMDIQCNGKFIMTAHDNAAIHLWPIKGGAPLASVVTNLGVLHSAQISPCGRFIAASGFTPEVRVWAIVADKSSGDVQSVEKAFELTGHSAAIPAFAFSGDSTHMLSVSKDKSFRLFDVNVDYKKRQSPRLIQHASWTAAAVDDKRPLHCALTNDSRCVVIAYRADLLILSGVDGTVRCRIDNCLALTPGGGSVDVGRLLLDPTSGFVLVIGGRVVRVFRNLVGLEVAVEALKESLKFASQDSVRSRIQGQMEAAETALQACRKKFTL